MRQMDHGPLPCLILRTMGIQRSGTVMTGMGRSTFFILFQQKRVITSETGTRTIMLTRMLTVRVFPFLGEMQGVDGLLSGDMNFYSPYYRQCSLETFTKDRYVAKRMPVAVRDVKNAFRFYLAKINRDRPFILAGFSQGAMIMLELLQEMDVDTYRRMVAAYAIGVSIPEETVTRCPRIVAAQGAADQGVTVCYNSVRDASCALWDKSAVVINPVNWRTDTTSALLVTEPTPRLPVKEQQKDTMVVHLDVESGLLFVDGYSATDYVLPLIGREGNYHSREIWLYRDALRENMALRAAEFLRGR